MKSTPKPQLQKKKKLVARVSYKKDLVPRPLKTQQAPPNYARRNRRPQAPKVVDMRKPVDPLVQYYFSSERKMAESNQRVEAIRQNPILSATSRGWYPVRERSLGRLNPDAVSVELRYPFFGQMTSASATVGVRWIPNAAYDVDPILGSTATPGFSEYASQYGVYRVHEIGINATMTNVSNDTLACYCLFLPQDPGTAGTSYYDYSVMPYCSQGILAHTTSGKDTHKFNRTVPLSKLLGSHQIAQDPNYQALINAVPTDLFWVALGAKCLTGATVTGVVYQGYISMKMEFYDRKNVTTFDILPTAIELEVEREKFHDIASEKYDREMKAMEKFWADRRELYDQVLIQTREANGLSADGTKVVDPSKQSLGLKIRTLEQKKDVQNLQTLMEEELQQLRQMRDRIQYQNEQDRGIRTTSEKGARELSSLVGDKYSREVSPLMLRLQSQAAALDKKT